MRALVTGGYGFLGQALVRALQDRGDEAVGFDKTSGDEVGDLASWPHVVDVVARLRPEVIFHTGALLSALAEADVLGAVTGNANGTFHVLEAARHFGVTQVVFTSTIATYGRAAGDVINDDSPQFPSSIYGVTKVYSERLGEYYQTRFGLDFRAIRFPSIVGPGRGASGLSAYSSLMIEKGQAGEPYTVPLNPQTAIPILYIDDAVRALLEISAASEQRLRRRCYLLAGFSPTAQQIADEVGSRSASATIGFAPDPDAQAIVDSWPVAIDESAAREDWDWKAQFDLPATVDAFSRP
ncbi:MAG: NAD-dependent epimerase/dehydratase family protein [Actinomycetota bacterium]